MTQLGIFSDQLDRLDNLDRKRRLIIPRGRDFSSNDYLGLARSEFIRDAARDAIDAGITHGSGGSRLLGGNHREHEALEAFVAEFYGREASLFFSSGYAANMALFSTLPQRGDIILYDALIHASTHDGMRLSRADNKSFAHNDAGDLEHRIGQYRAKGGTGTIWIAVESLYSMDGDIAPLVRLHDIAFAHDAMLVIDEAHASGVFGEGGRGLSSAIQRSENILTLHTYGKAYGLDGAIITMPQILRDFMINRGRPFIFSTAPSPMTAHLVEQVIRHVANNPQIPAALHQLMAMAHEAFGSLCPPREQDSQICPIIIGDDRAAIQIAAQLQRSGFDVRGIRPPTVPEGTSRLRVSLTLNVGAQDIEALASHIRAAQQEVAAA